MACLDTTLLVDLLRTNQKQKNRALAKIEALLDRGEAIVTTRINLAELYVGIELSDDPERDYFGVRDILNDIDAILEFDDQVARVFGQISAHLRRIGRPVADMDLLIAAIASENGHCLITQNSSHFADIPHLRVETY
jgi:predicted nucleic acid-binding protein